MCYPGEKQIKFCCLLPCTGSKTSVKFIAADSHKTTFSLYACASSIFFDCYSVMSDSEESLLRKTGVEFEVPGFDDSGSVSRNGVVNNSICWLCTVVQNGDSRIDPNQQIVSPKTRETTNYTVGYLLTHQQVCWSTRWVQQPDCSFCAHFNKWCCPESTKCGAPTVSYICWYK